MFYDEAPLTTSAQARRGKLGATKELAKTVDETLEMFGTYKLSKVRISGGCLDKEVLLTAGAIEGIKIASNSKIPYHLSNELHFQIE